MKLLSVKVIPRAKTNEVLERHGQLVVRVTAAPTDGKANVAVCKLLAKHFDLPTSHVQVKRGSTSTHKTITIG